MTKHKKMHTAAGSRKLYDKILISAYKIGRGITADLVWQFIKPDEFYNAQNRYYETDYFDLARVLSVFGVKQSARYPFRQYRNTEAVLALAHSNLRTMRRL